ncbi:hypothetical protein T261_4972 [Streptomyces lydicus]|nr:hypothetical protein T261_4972 [Streptomyces lydicus]
MGWPSVSLSPRCRPSRRRGLFTVAPAAGPLRFAWADVSGFPTAAPAAGWLPLRGAVRQRYRAYTAPPLQPGTSPLRVGEDRWGCP